ncbi:uncharacterized protein GBIM_14990 [Gryllus bimaculatus]|nr:uncharacterized protein GBIM_14990 [Gryllus bimaculatus]
MWYSQYYWGKERGVIWISILEANSSPDPNDKLSRLAKKLDEQKDTFAEVEALVSEAPLSEAKKEVSRAAKYFNYYATWAHAFTKKIEDPEDGPLVVVFSKPAPALALAAVVAPALAAGRTVILNPVLEASLASILFAELCSDVGFET